MKYKFRFVFMNIGICAPFFFGGGGAYADDWFNPAFLSIDSPSENFTDLNLFKEQGQQPGVYRVDVIVNGEFKETRDVDFEIALTSNSREKLRPVLSFEDLKRYGVKVELLPTPMDGKVYVDISKIKDVSYKFIFSRLRLEIGFPQVLMHSLPRGHVAPELWDDGINAFLMNYNFNGSNSHFKGRGGASNYYVGLRPGVNIGPWRFRHYGSWSYNEGHSISSHRQWSSLYTYVQRDIKSLKSNLTIGDAYSSSDVFDSIALRGFSLASNDAMLPESVRGYVPVVRGIAHTNAQVVIRQNNMIIHQSSVAPGPFEITDLTPNGGNDNLHVTIEESDGSKRHIVVPFSSLPVLQREGYFKYHLTTGQYRSSSSPVEGRQAIFQFTGMYGLPWGMTSYFGSQIARPYNAFSLGIGSNLGDFGALSFDVTNANSTFRDQPVHHGQSWRFRYSKNIAPTGTNLAIAGYRYSTRGFKTLQETLDSYNTESAHNMGEQRKTRIESTLSQKLWGSEGALSIGFFSEDYWGGGHNTKSLQIGYNNSWKGATYNVAYSYNRNTYNGNNSSYAIYDSDKVFSFGLSIPFDIMNSYANYNVSTIQGDINHSVSLSGFLLDDRSLNWNAQAGYSAGIRHMSNSSVGMNWRSPYAELQGRIALNSHVASVNYGASGGMLVHRDGVTFGQPLGETVALVSAPSVAGVEIMNSTGVKTDYRGYGIVPNVTAYQRNSIRLNTETLPGNAEVELNSKNVIPTAGAVSVAKFNTKVGRRVLMTVQRRNGSFVPFGSRVTDLGDGRVSMVSDHGLVYLTLAADSGKLAVDWGGKACVVNYTLPKQDLSVGVFDITATCK